jgi:hypothetical protein
VALLDVDMGLFWVGGGANGLLHDRATYLQVRYRLKLNHRTHIVPWAGPAPHATSPGHSFELQHAGTCVCMALQVLRHCALERAAVVLPALEPSPSAVLDGTAPTDTEVRQDDWWRRGERALLS